VSSVETIPVFRSSEVFRHKFPQRDLRPF
jgi:hypothetical protein